MSVCDCSNERISFPRKTGIKVTVIRPATTKHVEKYRAKSIVVVEETPACYQNVTLPRLKVLDFSLDVCH